MKKILFNTKLDSKNLKRKKLLLNEISKYKKPSESIILEVGIGNGRFGLLLGEYFKEYLGIDMDSEYLKLAKENIPKKGKIIYKKGRAEKIPFNKKVDIIFYANVWHFIKDFDLALKEIKRLLKRDGIVIILEPSENTAIWADSRLNKGSIDFNKNLLEKKIRNLKRARENLKSQDLLRIITLDKKSFFGSNYYLLKLNN